MYELWLKLYAFWLILFLSEEKLPPVKDVVLLFELSSSIDPFNGHHPTRLFVIVGLKFCKALSEILPPKQIPWSAPASTVGNALTVTSTASVLVQPFTSVTVTVYVAEEVGEKATPFETLLSHE